MTRARETAGGWEITTPSQTFHARHVIAATGGHNRPIVPPVETAPGSTVRAFHSSALADPKLLAGQRVVVVGGGASAFDLLDLCFEHDKDYVTTSREKMLGMKLEDMERRLIEATLDHYEGHRARAAQALGIGIRTLSNKLRQYGYAPRARSFVRAA